MYLVSLYSASNIFKLSLGKKDFKGEITKAKSEQISMSKPQKKQRIQNKKSKKYAVSKMLNSVLTRGAPKKYNAPNIEQLLWFH